MMVRASYLHIFLYLFISPCFFSQKILRLNLARCGRTKTLEISPGDQIQYRLKGQSHLLKNKIANLQDSLIIFANDSSIVLSDIRLIRFKKKNFAAKPVQSILLRCAVIFPIVTVTNRAVRHDDPYLREGAAIVSLSCFSLYLLVERLQIKRVRINKKHTLEIVDYNYKNLNLK